MIPFSWNDANHQTETGYFTPIEFIEPKSECNDRNRSIVNFKSYGGEITHDERVSKRTRFIHCSALIGCISGLTFVVAAGMCFYIFCGTYSVAKDVLTDSIRFQQFRFDLNYRILYAGFALMTIGLALLGFGLVMCCCGEMATTHFLICQRSIHMKCSCKKFCNDL